MNTDDKAVKSADKPSNKEPGGMTQAISLGTNLAAGMAVFCFLGYWIDKWRGGSGTGGWLFAGVFMGFLYGGYEVWKVVRMFSRDDKPGTTGIQRGRQR